ncbi:iron-only hydrogenase maturation rSAM protein HydG [Halobacteroides halobius DSM 5150]|uniref:Iron-only hydrogenase maturation rSAM protein HydG n=1 Tax=Halobacteroides halobius (strain ATCC 35273 / DSM 5150 / MD-1) TaxID=748449 RepID=L0KB19_HALHC|nr:[FeFe] hydrogenase H-cluster radical SAM maturase HydG [Halobacteroides halobius]AGB42497.1 iron-only hydrogenase maturation rSAM protein HydG [Halobacteroides halobius DSM 5150]
MSYDFIEDAKLERILDMVEPTAEEIERIINKSLNKKRLNLEETAILLQAKKPALVEKIFAGAKELKDKVYGDRIVLFAPLYVGNKCINNCKYCGFKASNDEVDRCTLTHQDLAQQIKALESRGQKRSILVYGEHPDYDADFIADTVKTVYQTKQDKGEIRRVNINAAPLEVAGYKKLKEVGIGTYQIFQETYHHDTYQQVHPSGPKSDFKWRLTGLDRAMEAGIDDVGIGALFGLYDWKYEVLGLLEHTIHLEEKYGVGPHTISFPRLKEATNMDIDEEYLVDDDEFKKLVAILRLAVPYTGLILTAREEAEIRREVIELGVSQIDAGTRIEMNGYTEKDEEQDLNREQFKIGDTRSLEEVIHEQVGNGKLPSFCTACYRLGRTGEHFMEFAIPGFIKRYCTPNAILTFKEYLEDYATEETRKDGEELIANKMAEVNNQEIKEELEGKLRRVEDGERDLYF